MGRRGTEVRQRRHQVGVRLLPEEFEKLQEHAEREGVSPAEVLRRGATVSVSENDLHPAESMALTVALAQVQRGEEPMGNVAAVCVLALARITGRLAPGWNGDV